jgi:lysophospholipid acyltransferase (LPLAT)-like uncharacterized protein
MKRLLKSLLKSSAAQWIAAGIISSLLRLIYLSSRVRKHYDDAALPFLRGEQQAIFCFWHGRMIFQPFIKPPRRAMRVLISSHQDGSLISIVMKWFFIGTVHGSRSKRGAEATLALLNVIAQGDNIAITPDGPRGPIHKAAPGATYLAAKTGLPIIPICFASSRAKTFRSWDRFHFPLPFGRVAFTAAAPLYITPAQETEATALLEAAMMQNLQAAEEAIRLRV